VSRGFSAATVLLSSLSDKNDSHRRKQDAMHQDYITQKLEHIARKQVRPDTALAHFRPKQSTQHTS